MDLELSSREGREGDRFGVWTFRGRCATVLLKVMCLETTGSYLSVLHALDDTNHYSVREMERCFRIVWYALAKLCVMIRDRDARGEQHGELSVLGDVTGLMLKVVFDIDTESTHELTAHSGEWLKRHGEWGVQSGLGDRVFPGDVAGATHGRRCPRFRARFQNRESPHGLRKGPPGTAITFSLFLSLSHSHTLSRQR